MPSLFRILTESPVGRCGFVTWVLGVSVAASAAEIPRPESGPAESAAAAVIRLGFETPPFRSDEGEPFLPQLIQRTSGPVEPLDFTLPAPTRGAGNLQPHQPQPPLNAVPPIPHDAVPLTTERRTPAGRGRATPVTVDPETQRRFDRYVGQRIDPQTTLDLQQGRPTLLTLTQPPLRIQIGDESVADYQLITDQELSLVGRELGTTVLNLWFTDADTPGRQEVLSYLVRVFPDPEKGRRMEIILDGLERDLNRAFPNSAVHLTYAGSQVIIRGQAKDIEEATQIARIVGASLPDSDQQETPLDTGGVFLNNIGFDSFNFEDVGGVEGMLRGQAGTGVNASRINRRVINLLQVAGVHQVMLKVTVAEVNRTASRAIGADLAIGRDGSASFFSLLPLAELGMPGVGGSLLVNRGDFELAINALKELNLARSLAEPNLVTLNGQPANFQVGGQFPVPQITGFTGAGLQGTEFIPFGVQLMFLPTVTDHDRVRLQLRATVSTRDPSISTEIGGGQVAGLSSRNFQTTVELREGQTLAIAGLIQNNHGANTRRVPFLGDVPYLGRLFSSDDDSYGEQELVVLVTPYLVSPVHPLETPALPGSDTFQPDDLEFFLKGRIEACRAEDFRAPVRTDIHKIRAYRRLEQHYIIGAPGHSDGRLIPIESLPTNR